MVDVLKSCSVQNGFAFSPTVQEIVGHVTELKLATSSFSNAFEVRNPADNSADTKVNAVGIMEEFHWAQGLHTKPLSFVFYVPLKTRTSVLSMIHTGMEDITVEVKFQIYEYDKEAKCWFKSVEAQQTLKGKISVIGGDRQIEISEKPGRLVQDPENFRLGIRVIPEGSQAIHMATSNSEKFVKQWGVT